MSKKDVYFFDDKEDNVRPFTGTSYNALQVSCGTRGAAEVRSPTCEDLQGLEAKGNPKRKHNSGSLKIGVAKTIQVNEQACLRPAFF